MTKRPPAIAGGRSFLMKCVNSTLHSTWSSRTHAPTGDHLHQVVDVNDQVAIDIASAGRAVDRTGGPLRDNRDEVVDVDDAVAARGRTVSRAAGIVGVVPTGFD